ncbi:MAG: phosphoenolpyruvate--protein phosphotransferase [Desulfobacterales bacterium]|nr:phosphoenolpyruvate--protein phosphotransferase [Desulfobacterales bacterium]
MTHHTKDPREIRLAGISASPGICIGKAYLVDREGVDVIRRYHVPAENRKKEISRFKVAVKRAKDELRAIIDDTPEDFHQHANIFETHVLLLKDKMLYGKTLEAIESKEINAEWALKTVVAKAKAMFRSMEDSYFRQRADDIVQVSDRIMRNLTGAEPVNIADINKRVILVARDLSPADTSQIQLERIMGFITDRGGKASHTSIIARTLEIPAVLGLKNATRVIENDDLIIVDGTSGVVILHPTEQTLVEFEEKGLLYESRKAVIARRSHLPAETLEGRRLPVMGNIELPEEVVSVLDHGGDGIGLYRTEFQYLGRMDFPREEELFEKYKDVVEVIAPLPVTIRTLDINGDKAVQFEPENGEENPALGLRAIRYCLKKRDVFVTQLRAILRAAVYGRVRILLPMISSCEEITQAKALLDEAAQSLEKDGLKYKREVELGIMIEVPSAVILADVMADEVDFFSIGTNDLIQYSLAIDRGNREVAYLFRPLHPAILRMVKHVADVAKAKGIRLAMCGEMAADPIHVPILLALGLDELSMNPQSIPVVKSMIRMISEDEAKGFLEEALKETTSSRIEKLINDRFGKMLAERIYHD